MKLLRFLHSSEQSDRPEATGYKGFYYHFLTRNDGAREWKSELSSIDSALLLLGILTVQKYFWRDTPEHTEIRDLAKVLFDRVDWRWMCNNRALMCMGWKPETGFLHYYWDGYTEGILLYILALGAENHSIEAESYQKFCSTYKWKTIYGHKYLYAGPLFIHQMPHSWIDFRGIRDEAMRQNELDYFENSRRATLVQKAYTQRNSRHWDGYSEGGWGISASDGPGPCKSRHDGRLRRFWGYRARGIPFGPDDGSLSPWAAVASLPFAPQETLQVIDYFESLNLRNPNDCGYETTYNLSYYQNPKKTWVSKRHIGINQGPVIMMIENHLTDFIWQLMRDCPVLIRGLKRAGFTGGWLEEK